MSISLRRPAVREYRQEFAAHHLGDRRDAISVFGNTEDYRRRRRYARALNGQACLADNEQRLLKFFLYASPVTERNGPLSFVIHCNSGFGLRPRSSFHKRWAHQRESLSTVQKKVLGA